MKYEVPDWYKGGNNPWYLPEKYLNAGLGNNAFSLDRNLEREPLWITPLKIGSLEDLKVGTKIVFQDYDENGKWVECVGLESAILCLDYDIPIYIFDNHNHVFYAWMEALKMGWIKKGGVLVHMDAHYDAVESPFFIPTEVGESLTWLTQSKSRKGFLGRLGMKKMADVWRYTNDVLHIATYIQPALNLGLFSRCVNYVESGDFDNIRDIGGECTINLDLDLFSEEMNHISWDQKMAVLKQYLPKAKLMTIATSPHFMEQRKAIEICRKIVNELF